MKKYICPVCKDTIPEGQLRGNNLNCEACSQRTDRSDLVEIQYNTFAENLLLKFKNALSLKTDDAREIPTLTSWDQLPETDHILITDINPNKSVRVRFWVNNISDLISTIICCLITYSGFIFSTLVYFTNFLDMQSVLGKDCFPLVFAGFFFSTCFTIFMILEFIKYHKKTWITADDKYFYIETWSLPKGKRIRLERDPFKTRVIRNQIRRSKSGNDYTVSIINNQNATELVITDRIGFNLSKKYTQFIEVMLNAKLHS